MKMSLSVELSVKRLLTAAGRFLRMEGGWLDNTLIYEPAHAKRGLMALIMKSRNRASKSGHAIA